MRVISGVAIPVLPATERSVTACSSSSSSNDAITAVVIARVREDQCPTASARASATSGQASGFRPAAFRARLRDDLIRVLHLVDVGALAPRVAVRFPLSEAASAPALAGSRTVLGKVILVPEP